MVMHWNEVIKPYLHNHLLLLAPFSHTSINGNKNESAFLFLLRGFPTANPLVAGVEHVGVEHAGVEHV